jgi:uncharacterized protein YceK
MSAMKRPLRVAALLALGLLTGCSTLASLNEGCPGVYSGVKYNRAFEESDVVTWRKTPDQQVILLVDLPLSAALDTILLPFTWFVGSREHSADGPGCEAVEQE